MGSDERPWIIAMTAEAMQGDRERFLAAGMNDYVVKPIRIEELVAAIERAPRRGEPAAPTQMCSTSGSSSGSWTAWGATRRSSPT